MTAPAKPDAKAAAREAKFSEMKRKCRDHRTRIKIGLERGNWHAVKADSMAILRIANDALDLLG